jgi:proteasome lid subunit RPN8/RPN11
MIVQTEKKFAVEVTYNGITKSLNVNPEERVSALLQQAISAFGITQNPHLLGLFRDNGTEVPDNQSIESAGLKPGELLLLRPSAVRGGEGLVRLADGLLTETFRTLRECGRAECECAVFWTGPSNESVADALEHPLHERSPFGYEVESNWLTQFWKRLAKSDRSVKVQLHSHPADAFHSRVDDEWPIVSQAGFLSVVIPDFAQGAPSLDTAWIGRLERDGTWLRLQSTSEAFSYGYN